MARLFDDGSAQYLERTASVPITGVPFTVAGWFNSDTNAQVQTLLNINNSSSTTYYHWLMLYNTNYLRAYSRDSSGSANAETTGTWNAGTWYHACGVWAATDDRRVFLNGGSKGTNTTARDPGTLNRLRVGSTFMSSPNENYFSGAIAELAAWNVALTDAEAAMVGLGVCPLEIRPNSLVAYWPLIRADRDRVGGYDLTPVNSPTVETHPSRIKPWWLRPTLIRVAIPAVGGILGERGTLRGVFRGVGRGI